MLSAPETDLTAVVISHNSASWLPGCLRSLRASAGVRLSVCVVDNSSGDESVAVVEGQFPDVMLIRSHQNLGFAGGANLGVRASDTDAVVILNPDVTVRESTLTALANALTGDPRAAVAGAKLLYPDERTIQHAGGLLSYPLALADHLGYRQEDRGQCDEPREVEFVTGAVLVLKRPIFEELGGFDEGFHPGYFEETDFCFRARQAGYRVLYVPEAVAVHHESVTTGRNTPLYYHLYHRNRIRFVLKHYSDEQFWRDYISAELEFGRWRRIDAELAALREAYVDNLAVLEGRADFIANPAAAASLSGRRDRGPALRVLRDSADRVLALGDRTRLISKERASMLRARWGLAEPAFVSNAPLVGPAIVGFRRVWNWMSTKWYVRPLVQQQNEFNELVVESLGAVESSAVDSERAVVQLSRDVALLESQLRRIEKRLAEMQRLLESNHDA